MQRALPLILIGFGVFFLLGALIVGWGVFPKVVQNKISNQVRLVEGTLTFDKWRNITTPIFIKYYLFNVTNPVDIVNGEKPVVTEIGPYVYEQKRLKTILSKDEYNDTVTYSQAITYYFRPDLSDGRTPEDLFTILNIPLAGFTASATAIHTELHNFVVKNKETLFIKRTVDQLLFKGYYQPTVKDIANYFYDGKEILPNFTFGLYYGKNGTAGTPITVHRGVEDSNEFGEIVNWNNQSSLDWWGGKYCNMINGTDGSIFPPFVTRDRQLNIFSEELCRSLRLDYKLDVVHNGIPGYRFALPKKLLQRAEVNEDNRCFCENIGANAPKPTTSTGTAALEIADFEFDDDIFKTSEEKEEIVAEPTAAARDHNLPPQECRAGVIYLSVCKSGRPIVASTPHFLYGEQYDVDNVIGLHPIEEKHETYIDLEINTGLVLQASKKIQINVQLKRMKSVYQMGKVIDGLILPILWADEFAAMPPERAEEFKAKLLSTFNIVSIAKWTIIGISCLLIALGIAVFVIRAKKTKYTT